MLFGGVDKGEIGGIFASHVITVATMVVESYFVDYLFAQKLFDHK